MKAKLKALKKFDFFQKSPPKNKKYVISEVRGKFTLKKSDAERRVA